MKSIHFLHFILFLILPIIVFSNEMKDEALTEVKNSSIISEIDNYNFKKITSDKFTLKTFEQKDHIYSKDLVIGNFSCSYYIFEDIDLKKDVINVNDIIRIGNYKEIYENGGAYIEVTSKCFVEFDPEYKWNNTQDNEDGYYMNFVKNGSEYLILSGSIISLIISICLL